MSRPGSRNNSPVGKDLSAKWHRSSRCFQRHWRLFRRRLPEAGLQQEPAWVSSHHTSTRRSHKQNNSASLRVVTVPITAPCLSEFAQAGHRTVSDHRSQQRSLTHSSTNFFAALALSISTIPGNWPASGNPALEKRSRAEELYRMNFLWLMASATN